MIATVSSLDLTIKKAATLKGNSLKTAAVKKLQHKMKMHQVVAERKKESFTVDGLLINMQQVTPDII